MKRFLLKILPKYTAVSGVLMVAMTQFAYADVIDKIFGFNIGPFVWTIANWFSYVLLTLASWFLSATGILLNTSLTITLHIRDFVTHISGVYEVWMAIRDLSGTLIIFFVLWAAFQIILGIQNPGLPNLLKNIVVAGVLINFSFFIAGFLIDMSNLVSFQIYRQMLPEKTVNVGIIPVTTSGKNNSKSIVQYVVSESYSQGGISDVFMSSFNLNRIFGNNGQFKAEAGALAIRMFVTQITGAAAMFVTGFTFIFASLAFIFRFAILLFLLAFSPVVFAASIIPQLQKRAEKGWDLFTGQLLFMPVYLLLMYMALKVVASSDFTATALNGLGGSDKEFWLSLLGIIGNFFFVIVLLLIPLWGAMSLGGSATKLANSWAHVMRKWSTNGLKASWRNTGGRAASVLARSENFKNVASVSRIGGLALKSVRGVAGGYDKKLSAQVKSRSEFAESLGFDKGAVRAKEAALRELRSKQLDLRIAKRMDEAKAMDKAIEAAEKEVEQTKNLRSRTYADTIDSRTYDTLWAKVARKDKVAAAKIQAGVVNKQLEKAKKDLEKAQEKVKSHQTKIDNLQAKMDAGEGDPVKSAKAMKDLKDKLPELYAKEKENRISVDKLDEEASKYDSIS